MSTHGHHHDHHAHAGHGSHDGLAELLELDAAVLHDYHAGIVAWVASQGPTRTIADLGAGTGAGTLQLLARFGAATVTAVDSDDAMLQRLAANAAARGLGERVRTLRADLDAGWPADLDGLDLIWAANSMHHMADPARVLRDIRAALAPEGRLALAELDAFPRFLPEGAAGGVEERCHTAMARRREQDMPYMGADWAAVLAGAGLKVEAERRFGVTMEAPLPEAAGRYAHASLLRTREGLADLLTADDLAALDELLADGPQSVLRRDDLTIRAARTVWIARAAS
ncbi:class I SAM-dependent methyltransferase [Dactylosporangium sp. McL0621]|uniref:class I SAM-dependent methyltransferase n=1 Tax=Dactylosporangium sp. McL0621 TaxID=3415678 RepID=UPI003CF754FA